MFGISREIRQQGGPFNVTSETTAWEIYNNRASVVDRELIKDWNDSLNSLLIFVRPPLVPRLFPNAGTGGAVFCCPHCIYN